MTPTAHTPGVERFSSHRPGVWWRSLVSIPALVTATLLALVVAASLQYQWIAQLSTAERSRLQSVLLVATSQFTESVQRELVQVGLLFLPAPEDAFDPQAAARTWRDWRRETPSLVAAVYRAPLDAGKLSQLDSATGIFADVAWPADMAGLRRRLQDATDSPPLPPLNWVLDEGSFSLVHSIYDRPPRDGQDSGRDFMRPSGFLLLRLNREVFLESWLPEQIRRSFSDADGVTYQVQLVRQGPKPVVVYRSDADMPDTPIEKPDARLPLFPSEARRGRMAMVGEGARPGTPFPDRVGPPRPDGAGFGGRLRFEGMHRHRPGRPFRVLTFGEGWELRVRDRAGSLDAAVSHQRNRNLAIGGAVLVLLGASISLVLVAARRAQQLARLQMEFVAGVSHELRTPLSVLSAAGDNLAQGVVVQPARVAEYGRLIQGEATRLTGMVEQILAFAAGEARRSNASLVVVDMNALVERAEADLAPGVVAASMQFEVDVPATLPPVMGDPAALLCCLSNLLQNAIKYGGDARWMRLEIHPGQRQGRDMLLVSVIDRGAGIPFSEMERIFEPFYRAQSAIDAQIRGTGLGLSLARQIAGQHGGWIEVESEPGSGSTFRLILPILEDVPAIDAPAIEQVS